MKALKTGYSLYPYLEISRKARLKPIVIQFIVKGKPRPKSTGYRVLPEQWDNDLQKVINHPNADIMNKVIAGMIAQHNQHLGEKLLAEKTITGQELKGKRNPTYGQFAAELKKSGLKTHLETIKAFHKSIPTLQEMDNAWLRKMEGHERERGMSQNYIFTTMAKIVAVLNAACKEGLINKDQFGGYTQPQKEEVTPTWLTLEEVDVLLKKMRTFQVNDQSREHMAIVTLLLGCYTGLRNSDWGPLMKRLDTCCYKVGNATFFNCRPMKNGGWVVLPVGKTHLEIFERLKNIRLTTSLTDWKIYIDRALVGLEIDESKNVTSHVGRHTFGLKCAGEGMSKSMLAALLGVTEDIVDVYFHLTGKHITEQAKIIKKW